MAAIMFELDRWIKARGDVVVTSQSDSVTLGVVGTKLVSSCGSLLPIFKPEKPEVASMLELGMSGCLKVNCATIVYLQQRHATRVFPPAVLLHPCPKL
eukprot:scaffold187077_cov18-Tisochrysis_lutea.AAC.1